MTHGEFTAAYANGEIRIEVDPKAAARFLSARLLLPLVIMPVLGVGVALALTGWIFTGLAVIFLAVFGRFLVRRSAPHFVFQQALQDPAVYDEACNTGLLKIVPAQSAGTTIR